MSESQGQSSDPRGMKGMAADPSTLASTGLLAAVVFAIGAGLVNFLVDPGSAGVRGRLLALTNTVDVGDVALLGIAVALLLLTPDPPGGINRTLLLQADAVLGVIIAIYGVIRAVVLFSAEGATFLLRFSEFVGTIGVALAAATVAFYAFKEASVRMHSGA